MIDKPDCLENAVIKYLKDSYGIAVAVLAHLPLGADIDASLFKAQTHDRTSYFVKLKRGHDHDVSAEIGKLLEKAGISQIISPVKTIHGQSTQQIDDFTLSVFPFIEGQDGFHRNLTDRQWTQLGEALRQVHEVEVPLPIQNRLRREVYSPKWREAVKELWVHMETKPQVDEIAVKLGKYMKENRAVIQRLVDRAQQLALELQSQSPKFVLCHSDIHGGNVLLAGNETIYIVDWDDPIMASKERDLMFIGGGVGNVWNQPQEEVLFYEGYGKTEVDATILSYYRHERIVEDIAEFGQELLLSRGRGKDRAVMYQQFISMFAPNGVVEIAFKTDSSDRF